MTNQANEPSFVFLFRDSYVPLPSPSSHLRRSFRISLSLQVHSPAYSQLPTRLAPLLAVTVQVFYRAFSILRECGLGSFSLIPPNSNSHAYNRLHYITGKWQRVDDLPHYDKEIGGVELQSTEMSKINTALGPSVLKGPTESPKARVTNNLCSSSVEDSFCFPSTVCPFTEMLLKDACQ